MKKVIELKDLSHVYPNGFRAVNTINLTVENEEVCVLIGPSGCGKSTTLNMINKLIPISEGSIWIDGKNINTLSSIELRRNIGYAIQEVALFPHWTVAQNIATVPVLNKWTKKRIDNRVDELLNLMGLEPDQYRDKYPVQLSGGEQQRVGVARALGADPPILLMDEPFGAIDPITRKRLQDEFLLIQEKIHKTVVFVTHDIQEALKMGNRIAILNGGELVQQGTPKAILEQPANTFVAEFMGTDRNMKWLQLTFAEELLGYSDRYAYVSDPVETVLKKAAGSHLMSIPILDKDGKMLGFVRERDLKSENQNWIKKVRPFEQTVERTTTIYDALFYIILDQNNYLPVSDGQGRYLGVITQDRVNALLANINNQDIEMGRLDA